MMRRRRHTRFYSPRRAGVALNARVLRSKRRRPRRTGPRRRRGLVPAIVILLALPLVAYGAYALVKFLHRTPRYAVQEIRVEGAQLFMPDEIIGIVKKAGVSPGVPILDCPVRRARRALLEDPLIRAAAVVRALPNTIVVRIIERTPIGWFESGGETFVVDADGYLAAGDSTTGLPEIQGLSLKKPKAGARVRDDRMSTALLIIRLYRASAMPAQAAIAAVDVRNLSNVRLHLAPGPKTPRGAVVLLGDGEFDKSLARLDVALHRENESFASLDLRMESRVPATRN